MPASFVEVLIKHLKETLAFRGEECIAGKQWLMCESTPESEHDLINNVMYLQGCSAYKWYNHCNPDVKMPSLTLL